MKLSDMEDLREQKKGQMITTVGDLSLWTICIDKDSLFNETSTRSLYFVNNNSNGQVKSDSLVIMDDDKNLYNVYAQNAIQDLVVLLGRRIPQSSEDYKVLFKEKYGDTYQALPVYDDCTFLEINLVMSDNHDKSLIVPLKVSCKEFLVKKILEQWYKVDFGSEQEESKLVHILQYRRKSVARRVRPLL